MAIKIPPIPIERSRRDPNGDQWDPWAKLKMTQQFAEILKIPVFSNPVSMYLNQYPEQTPGVMQMAVRFNQALWEGTYARLLVELLQPDLTLEQALEEQVPLDDPEAEMYEMVTSEAA